MAEPSQVTVSATSLAVCAVLEDQFGTSLAEPEDHHELQAFRRVLQ